MDIVWLGFLKIDAMFLKWQKDRIFSEEIENKISESTAIQLFLQFVK